MWESIETAPKDGTKILVLTKENPIYLVVSWGIPGLFGNIYYWNVESRDDTYDVLATDEILAWHPLPKPPNK